MYDSDNDEPAADSNVPTMGQGDYESRAAYVFSFFKRVGKDVWCQCDKIGHKGTKCDKHCTTSKCDNPMKHLISHNDKSINQRIDQYSKDIAVKKAATTNRTCC